MLETWACFEEENANRFVVEVSSISKNKCTNCSLDKNDGEFEHNINSAAKRQSGGPNFDLPHPDACFCNFLHNNQHFRRVLQWTYFKEKCAFRTLDICLVLNHFLLDQQPKTTYLFLGNVALTDTITSIAILIGIFVPKDSRSHNMCAFQIGLIVASTLASIFSVALIAVDRFLFIVYGIFYSKWMYPHRARTCIAAIWIVGS